MPRFCTQCGESLADGLVFCTGCGTRQGTGPDPARAVVTGDPLAATIGREIRPPAGSEGAFLPGGAQGTSAVSEESGGGFFRKPLVRVVALVVVLVASVGGSFTVGRSSIDQEKIRLEGYDAGVKNGYENGKADGYTDGKNDGVSEGYGDGYSTGYSAGCREAFKFSDGTYNYITAYDPFSYFDKTPSDYYKSDSIC